MCEDQDSLDPTLAPSSYLLWALLVPIRSHWLHTFCERYQFQPGPHGCVPPLSNTGPSLVPWASYQLWAISGQSCASGLPLVIPVIRCIHNLSGVSLLLSAILVTPGDSACVILPVPLARFLAVPACDPQVILQGHCIKGSPAGSAKLFHRGLKSIPQDISSDQLYHVAEWQFSLLPTNSSARVIYNHLVRNSMPLRLTLLLRLHLTTPHHQPWHRLNSYSAHRD